MDLPFLRPVKSVDAVEECRLPGTVRANKREYFTVLHAERDAIESNDARKVHVKILYVKLGHERENC